MKILAIGFGQCGGRIADEFNNLNNRSKSRRGIEIVTGAFAVNTDTADLSGLSSIKADNKHRILIGGGITKGHGVAKLNELGAEIARGDADKVIDAIRQVEHFYETDAIIVIAGSGGGTGSGAISVMAQRLKQRYVDKPVYAIIVLPFDHEQQVEERTIYNTGVCLKSISSVADAVFLIDNQRFVKKDSSLRNNVEKINQLIVEPFYNLLCAGEEKRKKHIGTKVLDAGDIMQTLSGWTVIGYGKAELSSIKLFSMSPKNFMKKSKETHKGAEAMEEAISELTLLCDPNEAMRALYLLSAPTEEMNVSIVQELGEYVKKLAPNAVIRSGDYPTERGMMDVTIILSQIRELDEVKEFYSKAIEVGQEINRKTATAEDGISETKEASKDIPTLI
ncbi:tubulin/FtsZ family protein [Chloroflexota bacterium]